MIVNSASILREKLSRRDALVVPGCHDALSARIIESCAFQAVQVSGFGLAGSLLGKPDVGLVEMKDILDHTWNIVRAVRIPVMADIDTGGGNALNTAEITAQLIQMGVAGVNLEDQVFPKRCGHMEGKQVIGIEEMIGKIRIMSDVRKSMGSDVVINARTDAYAVHGLDEALHRGNAYLTAGADMVFLDGLRTRVEIERAAREIRGLLSVNLMDAVSGVKTELVSIPELARLRVARVSIPVASILVMHRALQQFFEAMRESPTGLLEGQNRWITPFSEYNDFVGMREYRQMENEYLPRATIEVKYPEDRRLKKSA